MDEAERHMEAFESSPPTIAINKWNENVARLKEGHALAEEYGTIMTWHRWIDSILDQAIRAGFALDTKGAADNLLTYPGGLSSFSARAHRGRCLGLYGGITYADIKTINDIRNDFAHPRDDAGGMLEVVGFHHPDIVRSCAKLSFLKHAVQTRDNAMPAMPRDQYVITASKIAFSLWMSHILPHSFTNTADLIKRNVSEFLP